ncbi:MAG: hypothetical protein ACFE0I_03765 [Elainellaceae cyanobacterium]
MLHLKELSNAPPPPYVSVEQALNLAGEDAVYYGTHLRGASNAKAKRELSFQPRSLEWIANIAIDSREIVVSHHYQSDSEKRHSRIRSSHR